ncbi:hypothetical protein [Streptomyces sp. NPDC055189]
MNVPGWRHIQHEDGLHAPVAEGRGLCLPDWVKVDSFAGAAVRGRHRLLRPAGDGPPCCPAVTLIRRARGLAVPAAGDAPS